MQRIVYPNSKDFVEHDQLQAIADDHVVIHQRHPQARPRHHPREPELVSEYGRFSNRLMSLGRLVVYHRFIVIFCSRLSRDAQALPITGGGRLPVLSESKVTGFAHSHQSGWHTACLYRDR
jgi:hypothetical protein